MDLQFIECYPYRALEPELQALMASAQRLEAAIAFVTRPGVAMLRQYLKAHGRGSARLVASVRFPTDPDELANLEDDYPGTVFLHTGFQTPIEKGADRGQFHSKVVLLELNDGERCIVLGSHNWTGNALQGINMGAGFILRCDKADRIVAEVAQHIDACAFRSEPFSRRRLRFYKTVQCQLHRKIGPGAAESECFPAFEEMKAVVIHAEDATGGIPHPLQLFIPVRDTQTRGFLADRRRVLLYVYPAGSLLSALPPSAAPTAYEGSVTMTNVVEDASAEGRPATCRLVDLRQPRIELLPGGTVPPPAGEISQVVIRFENRGQGELPIFHAAGKCPRMRYGVEYHAIDRDKGDQAAERGKKKPSSGLTGPVKESPSPAEYYAPLHLTLEAEIKVPSRALYRSEIERVLRRFLHSSDLFDETVVADLKIGEPAAAKMLNPYVYNVNYWFTKETIERVEKQLRLFGD